MYGICTVNIWFKDVWLYEVLYHKQLYVVHVPYSDMEGTQQKQRVKTTESVNLPNELIKLIDEAIPILKNEFGQEVFRSRDAFVRKAVLRLLRDIKSGEEIV